MFSEKGDVQSPVCVHCLLLFVLVCNGACHRVPHEGITLGDDLCIFHGADASLTPGICGKWTLQTVIIGFR